MPLTITAFSTALFSTWWLVEEFALLLDCGDGACAGLLQKSRLVRTVAISHSDRDHITGLPQFLQLNAREGGLPVVVYPRDCASLPALRSFLHRFDRFHLETEAGNRWEPIAPGQAWELGKAKARIEPILNRHIEASDGQIKSLSYRVLQEHRRLRPEFAGLDEAGIAEARGRLGDAAVMIADSVTLLTYSADTPIEAPDFWGQTKVLIHEATFLRAAEAGIRGQFMGHSALDQVIPMAAQLPLEALILGHFSTRHGAGEIIEAIRNACRRCRPGFPVHAVMPGGIHRDILRSRPVWEP